MGVEGSCQNAPVILRVLSRIDEFILTDFLYFRLPLLPKFVIPAFVKF